MAIKKLDVVTQVCPFPLIEAKAALAEMASGDKLVIEFDCTQELKQSHSGRQKKDMPSPIISRLAMLRGASPFKKPDPTLSSAVSAAEASN